VKVALSGIGGDEVFGGYPRYIGARLSLYYEKLPFLFRSFLRYFSISIKPSPKGRDIPGRIKRFLKAGLLMQQERYLSWITYFDHQMKDKLYNADIKREIGKGDYIHLYYFREANDLDYLNRIVYVDINTYLPDDLLIMGDRMSMANSLELRVPFCDHKLMEFCFFIPYQCKLKGLRLKGLLKEILKEILPQEILNKPKQGFMVPLANWLRKDLKDYALSVLSPKSIKKRRYFNSQYVEKILKDHFLGKDIFTHQIWALLILEMWFKEFIDD
jgi:asparagine synthase (glutamine-hydrolysing)